MIKRFAGFSVVGGVVMVAGLFLLSFLVEVIKVDKILAGAITTIVSVEVNFVLNKYLNWRDKAGSLLNQWWKFHAVRIGVIVINQLLYSVLVLVGLHYLFVTIFLTIVVTVISYISNDRFVFQEG